MEKNGQQVSGSEAGRQMKKHNACTVVKSISGKGYAIVKSLERQAENVSLYPSNKQHRLLLSISTHFSIDLNTTNLYERFYNCELQTKKKHYPVNLSMFGLSL
jgi:hypothetical protein